MTVHTVPAEGEAARALLAQELSSAPDLGDLSSAAAGRRAKAALATIEANRWQTQP
jgi:hypothetical protein